MRDKTNLSCIICHEPYEASTTNIGGIEKVLSPYCLKCRAKKRAEFEENERIAIEIEKVQKRLRWVKDSGIPIRFQGVSFDTFINRGGNTDKVLSVCRDYAESLPLFHGSEYHSLGLFSEGVWGVGKTHLACSIAHRVMERWQFAIKCPVYCTTESHMFLRIRSTFNREKSHETEGDIYEQLINIPLLIVDDVGKEEVSDPRFVQRAWYYLVNGRYDNLLPLVLTANLDPDGIAHHLGGSRNNEATWDRLYEMTKGVFYKLESTSYRREKKSGMSDKTR